MDWTKLNQDAANRDGGERSSKPKLGTGKHTVKVSRTIIEKSDGTPVTDSEGNPAMFVIYANADGEALDKVPLSEASKTSWKTAALFAHACTLRELESLTRSRLTFPSFLDEALRTQYLHGRSVVVEIKPGRNGYNDLRVVGRGAAPAAPATPPALEDDIPF